MNNFDTFFPYPIDENEEREYTERLNTFNALNWRVNTIFLNPIFCSKHGWKIKRENTITCASCKTILWVDFKNEDLSVLNKFRELIKRDSHKENCFWYRFSVSDRLVSLPPLSSSPSSPILVDSFCHRFSSLLSVPLYPSLHHFKSQNKVNFISIKFIYFIFIF